MTGDYELTWKRNPETGNWQATDDRANPAVTYIAGRTPAHSSSRPDWGLTAHVPGRSWQARAGLTSLKLAQAAALATRCHLCFRHVPFADTEQSGKNGGWRCQDREDCAAVVAERAAGTGTGRWPTSRR